MDTQVKTKGLIGLCAGVVSYLYGSITELFIILGMLLLSDYVLGILADMKSGGQFNKNKALWGAIKKVLYGWVLAMALFADYIIRYVANESGVDLKIPPIATLAALFYLLGTELFSNGKHLIILGVPVPGFLMDVFGLIRDQGGKIMPTPKEEGTIKKFINKMGEE